MLGPIGFLGKSILGIYQKDYGLSTVVTTHLVPDLIICGSVLLLIIIEIEKEKGGGTPQLVNAQGQQS